MQKTSVVQNTLTFAHNPSMMRRYVCLLSCIVQKWLLTVTRVFQDACFRNFMFGMLALADWKR